MRSRKSAALRRRLRFLLFDHAIPGSLFAGSGALMQIPIEGKAACFDILLVKTSHLR